MPSFAQTGVKSNAMYDLKNTNGGYKSPATNLDLFTSGGSMARADTAYTSGGSASTNTLSIPHSSRLHVTSTTSAPTSSTMTSKTMAPFGRTDAYPDKASISYSYCRPTLSDVNSSTFQDLIRKGRKAQADDKRTVYETKKAKQEADRAKATRARLATDTAVRSLALESRSYIDTCKRKLVDDMEKNLKALLESEFRAEIREKVYEDEKKISATYEREIKDSTRLQLENDLEPVIVAELSAKHEEEVKEMLRAELEGEVKEELRARYKVQFEEELRVELEDTVRKELQDIYRDEVRSELKRELSPSVRAELIGSLGLHHGLPNLEDLENQQPSYSDLGNIQHLNYNGDFQGYGGESQYDEEEGDDVFDDAPEQFSNGLVTNDNVPNLIVDADHFGGGLVKIDDLPNSILDPNHSGSGPVNNDKIPQPIIDADQCGSGSTSTGSQKLKRHIDEDYDESDEEEHLDVDLPAEKKIKTTAHYDLPADEGSSSANNVNGDYQDEQARDDGARYGKNDEDVVYPQLNGNSNAFYGEEQSLYDGGEKDFGHCASVDGNVDAYFGEEQWRDAKGPKEDGYLPDLNGNGNEDYAEEGPQSNEDQHEETQHETSKDEEGDAGYQDQELKPNAFHHEEGRDTDEEDSEEEEEEDDDEDDAEEENDEAEDVGDNDLAYGRAQEPLGNHYLGRQINGADRFTSCRMKHHRNEEDDEDLGDTALAYERAQQPFGNHYGGTQINETLRVFSGGVKHFRSEEEEEEEDEARDSKRHRGESYSISEEEYSEVDSMEDDDKSEGQDAQGGNIYGLIKESNTQETAVVIDSSDDEDNSQAVDEEKTLVDDEDFLSSRIQTYLKKSHFVEN